MLADETNASPESDISIIAKTVVTGKVMDREPHMNGVDSRYHYEG